MSTNIDINSILANPRVLIVASATIFFFAVFSLLLGRSKHSYGDTESRIRQMVMNTPDTVIDAGNGKKRARRAKKKIQNDRTRKKLRQLEDELYNVGISMPATDFITYWVGSMVLLSLALSLIGISPLFSVLIVGGVAFFPIILIRVKKNKRRDIIESQLVDCIQILCNSLKAGHSFMQAIQSISSEMEGPIAEEFDRVYREAQHGMELDDSLEALSARIGSDDLTMMCTAVEIQRQVGGNLSQILLNISSTIKSRLGLKAEIKVRSASGRISGIVIGSLPVLLFVMFLFVNPEYMKFFTNGGAGYICIGICLGLEALGFLFIKKIVDIKY